MSNPRIHTTPYVATLTSHACIAFSGEDALDFLQGQFTNDLASQQPGEQRINGYCNPKGRLLAVFRMLRDHDRWVMVIPRDLCDAMAKRLTLYRMRAKVTIEVLEDVQLIGIGGTPETGLPDWAGDHVWQIDDQRWIALVARDGDSDVIPAMNPDDRLWQIDEIRSGIPTVTGETSEQFIPQHINLDLVGGVSFSKGCYPGQEIVARLRYLGKLKQRMIGGTVVADESQSIQPGTPVFTPERGDTKAGLVVAAAADGSTHHLLINVPAGSIESGDLHIGAADGPVVDRVALPYDITIEMRSREKP